MRPESEQPHVYYMEEGQPQRGSSLLDKYRDRPEEEEEATYLQFLQEYTHRPPYKRRPRAHV